MRGAKTNSLEDDLDGDDGKPAASDKPLSSKYRGVCWNRKNKRWQAAINTGGKYVYLGSFLEEYDAARAFDKAAVKLRGARAKLNFAYSDYVDDQGNLLHDPKMRNIMTKIEAVQTGTAAGCGTCGSGGWDDAQPLPLYLPAPQGPHIGEGAASHQHRQLLPLSLPGGALPAGGLPPPSRVAAVIADDNNNNLLAHLLQTGTGAGADSRRESSTGGLAEGGSGGLQAHITSGGGGGSGGGDSRDPSVQVIHGRPGRSLPLPPPLSASSASHHHHPQQQQQQQQQPPILPQPHQAANRHPPNGPHTQTLANGSNHPHNKDPGDVSAGGMVLSLEPPPDAAPPDAAAATTAGTATTTARLVNGNSGPRPSAALERLILRDLQASGCALMGLVPSRFVRNREEMCGVLYRDLSEERQLVGSAVWSARPDGTSVIWMGMYDTERDARQAAIKCMQLTDAFVHDEWRLYYFNALTMMGGAAVAAAGTGTGTGTHGGGGSGNGAHRMDGGVQGGGGGGSYSTRGAVSSQGMPLDLGEPRSYHNHHNHNQQQQHAQHPSTSPNTISYQIHRQHHLPQQHLQQHLPQQQHHNQPPQQQQHQQGMASCMCPNGAASSGGLPSMYAAPDTARLRPMGVTAAAAGHGAGFGTGPSGSTGAVGGLMLGGGGGVTSPLAAPQAGNGVATSFNDLFHYVSELNRRSMQDVEVGSGSSSQTGLWPGPATATTAGGGGSGVAAAAMTSAHVDGGHGFAFKRDSASAFASSEGYGVGIGAGMLDLRLPEPKRLRLGPFGVPGGDMSGGVPAGSGISGHGFGNVGGLGAGGDLRLTHNCKLPLMKPFQQAAGGL